MGIKSFFRKVEHGVGDVEKGAKKFFSKDTGRRLDNSLRKVQNTLPKVADGISKAGAVAGMIAPAVSAVPLIGVPASAGLASFSASSPAIAKGLKEASHVSRGVRNEVNRPTIQRAKPQPQEESEMFGNLFA
jgi:hypothetical protein